MAPSAKIVRRASNLQRKDIAFIVGIAVAGTLLLALIIISLLLIRRWRQRRLLNEHLYPVPISSSTTRAHKLNLSDASANPLLEDEIRGDWSSGEKPLPPIRQSIDGTTRDNRQFPANDSTQIYSLSFAQAPGPSAAPSLHPTHSPETERSIYKQTQLTSLERPPLPPLVIPTNQAMYPRVVAVVAEETPSTRPPSSCPSTESLYSQTTLESASNSPSATYFHLPLSQEMTYGAEPASEELKRHDTHLVGNLLKARAQRNPAGLVRTGSQVSRIERMGSIKSVVSIDKNDRPFSRRYRSKKKQKRQSSEMEVVMEGMSESSSPRSRSGSFYPPWDPTILVQAPPPVALSPHSPLMNKA